MIACELCNWVGSPCPAGGLHVTVRCAKQGHRSEGGSGFHDQMGIAMAGTVEQNLAAQGIVLPASRYWLTVFDARPRHKPNAGMAMMVAIMTTQSMGVMKSIW